MAINLATLFPDQEAFKQSCNTLGRRIVEIMRENPTSHSNHSVNLGLISLEDEDIQCWIVCGEHIYDRPYIIVTENDQRILPSLCVNQAVELFLTKDEHETLRAISLFLQIGALLDERRSLEGQIEYLGYNVEEMALLWRNHNLNTQVDPLPALETS